MIGILFALLSSLFFGLYIVPRKLSKLPAVQFSTLMAIGFSVGSIVLYLVQIALGNNEGLGDPDLLFAVLAGAMWATALMLLVKSIDVIGIARSNQWKNLQGPVGVILALIVLNETATVNPLFALLSGFAIFTSALLFNIQSGKQDKNQNKRGVILALTSGLLFGSVAIINKYVTDNAGVYSQQVIWSLSILGSLLLYQIFTKQLSGKMLKKGKDLNLGLSSGFLYLGASLFFLLSLKTTEASITFTIVQMNFLVVIVLGIFVFHEFKFKGNKKRVALGLLFALAGVALLTFAR